MEINYGIYILILIIIFFITGIICLLLDCIIKPRIVSNSSIRKIQRYKYNTNNHNDDIIINSDLELTILDTDHIFNTSSTIFDDDIT